MWNHKQLLLVASKRNLQGNSKIPIVLRNSFNAASRHFSSVIPNINNDNGVVNIGGHTNDSFTKKLALQNLLLTSSAMVAKLPAHHHPNVNDCSTIGEKWKSEKEIAISPSELIYTGNATMPVTSDLHIVTPEEDTPRGIWPVFRMLVGVHQCTGAMFGVTPCVVSRAVYLTL